MFKSLRNYAARGFALLVAGLYALFVIVKFVTDIIGRNTVPEDAVVLWGRLMLLVDWLSTIPGWIHLVVSASLVVWIGYWGHKESIATKRLKDEQLRKENDEARSQDLLAFREQVEKQNGRVIAMFDYMRINEVMEKYLRLSQHLRDVRADMRKVILEAKKNDTAPEDLENKIREWSHAVDTQINVNIQRADIHGWGVVQRQKSVSEQDLLLRDVPDIDLTSKQKLTQVCILADRCAAQIEVMLGLLRSEREKARSDGMLDDRKLLSSFAQSNVPMNQLSELEASYTEDRKTLQ